MIPVVYENGSEGTAAVSWEQVLPETYAQPGEFTVGGRVEGTALPAVAEVIVTEAAERNIVALQKVHISTPAGVAPSPPTVVQATYSDNTSGETPAVWQKIDPGQYAAPGTFTVNGAAEGTALPALAEVSVLEAEAPGIVSLEAVEVTTTVGIAPALPSVVTAVYSDKSISAVPVVWQRIAPQQYANTGSFIVNGTVEGTGVAAKATVTVIGAAPTPTPAPNPTPAPTLVPTPSASAGTVGMKTQTVGEDIFTKNQGASNVEVTLNDGKTEALLPVNAGVLLGTRSLIVKDGEASLVIPASVLVELSARLPENERKGAALVVTLTPVTSGTIPSGSGSGIYRQEGAAYEFGLLLRKGDGAELVLSAFPQPVRAELPYSAAISNDELLGVYVKEKPSSLWGYAGGSIDSTRNKAVIMLNHFSTYAVFSYDKTFTDVASTHWVYAALKSLSAKHVVTGVTDNLFSPGGTATRAEFTAMLARMLNLKSAGGELPFSDINSGNWYAESVAAAYQAGLVQGVTATAFSPDAEITREQMAVLLVKAYEYKLGRAAASGEPLRMVDAVQVSDWAKAQVAQALASGIMQGAPDGRFDPQGSASRAQTVQALANLLSATDKKGAM